MKRDNGMCQWPQCGQTTDLQMAHLVHRGMGGSAKANVLANVTMLCVYHHDILDGRTVKGRRRAVTNLLAAYLKASHDEDTNG